MFVISYIIYYYPFNFISLLFMDFKLQIAMSQKWVFGTAW